MKAALSRLSLLGALFSALASCVFAQTEISTMTTSTTDAADSISEGYNFQNTTTSITTFYTATTAYSVSGLANSAYVRRNTTAGNPDQSSVWYTQGSAFLGPHSNDYASLLLGNDINHGSDNTFSNDTGAAGGNIERLDFVTTGGMAVNDSMGFAVFDRGATGVHDAFKIAVITGWDSINNVPTSYGQLVGQAANWGSSNLVSTFGYTLFRYNNGDNLTANYASSETGNQGVGGVVFTLAELGISSGTTIYGYSLFGYDVTDGGNSANLIDWTNSSYYSTTTTGATGTGGIDLLGLNGITFSAIPEPSTYMLFGTGLMIVAIAFRHWRQHRMMHRG